jgi:SCO1/SenC
VIGPAPPFTLTSQDAKPVALADLRGKVVAVTFIYTGFPDICPLLTQKMVDVQDALGSAVRCQDRLCFDQPRSGARHARGVEGLCPILGRQARGVELLDRPSRGGP